MYGCSVQLIKDSNDRLDKVKVERHSKEGLVDSFDLRLGDRLIIDPLNPKSNKNRGRVVEAVEVESFSGETSMLKVRFLDTKRSTSVEFDDVRPYVEGINV